MYAKGFPQYQIADTLGISQPAVSKHLSVITEEWQRRMREDCDRIKAEQLAKIDKVELAAWEGWERSVKEHERRTVKTTTATVPSAVPGLVAASASPSDVTLMKEFQAGDTAFLSIILKCAQQRAELIGAITKGVKVMGHDGGPFVMKRELKDLAYEDLAALESALEGIVTKRGEGLALGPGTSPGGDGEA